MMGFETIGNATLICYDGEPLLVTDPWITDAAYFGSWTQRYEIPPAQLDAISRAKYIWFSHGHPDHLNADSLSHLTGKTFLIPDHVGGRIARDFRELGLNVRIMKDRTWLELSPRLKVLCMSDYFQDASLLLEMNGHLLMNVNDSAPRGHAGFLRRLTKNYRHRVLLKTFGYGDIDMMNFFREEGPRIKPFQAAAKEKGTLSNQLAFWGKFYNATDIVPFSSFHEYQRTDSLWAAEYTAPLSAFHNQGSVLSGIRIRPAFVRWNCATGEVSEINPKKLPIVPKSPEEFGDKWSEELDKEEQAKVIQYFKAIEKLGDSVDFINCVVGGKALTIPLADSHSGRGLQFEVPRSSLVTAVTHHVFDDLLIGNFMRTRFIGPWTTPTLEGFTPFVGKFADNGLAHSRREYVAYLAQYRNRFPADFLLHRFGRNSERIFRKFFKNNSPLFRAARKVYSFLH